MKKFYTLGLVALLSLGVVSCGDTEQPNEPTIESPDVETPDAETPDTEANGFVDGVYTGTTEQNENGMSMVAEVTIEGGIITNVFLDEVGANGSVRESEVETETENKTVGAQLDALALEIVNTQNTLEVNSDSGLVDAVAGCTMKAQPYINAVNLALAQAE